MMSTQCVVAIFDDLEAAKAAVMALEKSGFAERQVSLVTHAVKEDVPLHQEAEMEFGDEGVANAMKGAGLGGLFGALIGSPLLLVTGLGAAVVAGPLAAAATGAVIGGFLGGMSGWGVHTDHLQEYEDKVREGKVLVVVSGDADNVADAERILTGTEAIEVRVHTETEADSPEIDDRPYAKKVSPR
jgi:hypothetical protein